MENAIILKACEKLSREFGFSKVMIYKIWELESLFIPASEVYDKVVSDLIGLQEGY